MKTSKFPKALLSFVFLFFAYTSINVTYAGPKEWAFRVIGRMIEDTDITRTVQNMFAEATTGIPLALVAQRNADEYFACAIVYKVEQMGVAESDMANELAYNLQIPDTEASQLVTEALAMDDAVCDFSQSGVYTRNGGSLHAMSTILNQGLESGISPVNLAVYFKDIARRVPILKDTSYAAEYNLLEEDIVLKVWKLMRNLAYGVVSISMIVVGIMIMMRRKINPQTAVTIQNAFPRLVLSIVLITFSFPIGATLASMAIPAMSVSNGFFVNDPNALGNSLLASGGYALVIVLLYALITMTLPGLTGLVIAAVYILVLFVIYIIALLKVYMSYLRLIFNTITSPLIFAVGAIPGKESVIGDWFKNMAVEIGAVGATYFMIKLAFYVGIEMMGGTESLIAGIPTLFTGHVDTDRTIFSRALALVVAPIVVMMIMGASMKMRGAVRGWILGDKAKRR